jgi:hypothetical protein
VTELAVRLLRVGTVLLFTLTFMACHAHPPASPVEGWRAGFPDDEALVALTEAWWPAMLGRDTTFFNQHLDRTFRWAGPSQVINASRGQLAAALEGAYCGPDIIYEITRLQARALRQAGVATSYGTVWVSHPTTDAVLMQDEFAITLLFRRTGQGWLITEAHVLSYQHEPGRWRKPNFDLAPLREVPGGPVTPPIRLDIACP